MTKTELQYTIKGQEIRILDLLMQIDYLKTQLELQIKAKDRKVYCKEYCDNLKINEVK